jgi:uncharacterized membrane protein YqiK
MDRVIARVVSGTWLAHAISAILTTIFAIAVLTIQNVDLLIMIMVVLASIAIVATIIIILPRTVAAAFTEDELIIKSRDGTLTIPRSVVTSGNVLCIERGHRGFRLRVVYGGLVYSIPMSKWVHNKLVSRLREHWDWVPPKC